MRINNFFKALFGKKEVTDNSELENINKEEVVNNDQKVDTLSTKPKWYINLKTPIKKTLKKEKSKSNKTATKKVKNKNKLPIIKQLKK
jgi:hypothetical protein